MNLFNELVLGQKDKKNGQVDKAEVFVYSWEVCGQ